MAEDEQFKCKYCQSEGVVKFGTYKGIQRYYCKVCRRKFKADANPFRMRIPANHVSSALSMYYEGMSLSAICRHFGQENSTMPSTATIYEWIEKYTPIVAEHFRQYHPKVGNEWVADETVVKMDGQSVWLWDIIDSDTRYLLATRMSFARTTRDAQLLMDRAINRAGKSPKVVYTDKLASYLDVDYGKKAEHRQGSPFNIENNTNLIERFHGTLKARTKVMRGLKDIETAHEFTDGWLVHYNYFMPHEALNDKTPAEVSGIDYPVKNWADAVKQLSPNTMPEVSKRGQFRARVPRLARPHVNIGRPHKRIRKSKAGLGKVHLARQGGGLTRRMDR